MFQKVDFVKGTDVFSMEKVSDKVFISTSIENIMYNGTKTSFMGRGFPNVKVRDVFTDGDKNWFVYNDHIIFEKNKGFGMEKIPFSASDVIIQAYLIDGNKFKSEKKINYNCVVGGDNIYQSIAAASILAKVSRDMKMKNLNYFYPKFSFNEHKGYGTKKHIQAINKYGLSPIHRLSFKLKEKQLSLKI